MPILFLGILPAKFYQGAALFIANRSFLDLNHILYGQLHKSEDTSKERLKPRCSFEPTVRHLGLKSAALSSGVGCSCSSTHKKSLPPFLNHWRGASEQIADHINSPQTLHKWMVISQCLTHQHPRECWSDGLE